MYCNVHLTPTYLCDCDCDYASMYPTLLRGKSSTPCREPPHEPSCCCNYDPFTDETKDTEIHDLGFALRKLAVMKCQMKKWRRERLQLESEARSLKNKLKSLGVNVREPLIDDPLIIHYRDENGRLEKIREQLEDKIKDLEMRISENELYKNPCEGIQIIREKMRALREESQRDKKKLEETIKELSIEFAESSGGSPCAGVTRLRAKIRELMDQLGKKMLADKKEHSGAIIERSIVTLPALSKSCDDLRLENERIRVENQNLQRALRPTRDDIDVDSGGARIHPVIGDKLGDDAIDVVGTRQGQSILEKENKDDMVMKMKLLECNNLIDDLKRQITEKDVTLLSKDDEIKKLLDEKDKILSDSAGNYAVLQSRIDDLLSQEILSRKEVDGLKEQTQIIPSLRNQNSELTSKLTSLEKKLGVTQSESLMDKLVLTEELKDSAQLELTTLKKELDQLIINLDYAQKENINLNTERDILKRQIVEIQQELSNKIADNVDLSKSTDKATSELNELQLENESLKKRIIDMVKDIENWKTEISKDTREIDKLNRELEDAKNALDLSQSRISELDDELSHSQLESHELSALQRALSEEKLAKGIASDKINNLNEELDALKSELMNCRDENGKLRNDLSDTKRQCTQLNEEVNNFQSEVQALKSQNEKIKGDNELLKRDLIGAQGDFQAQKIEADTLKIDNTALKGEGDRLRFENSNIKINLNNLKDINENLSSELEILKTDLLKCQTERDKLTLELEKYTKMKNEYDSSIKDSEVLKEALSNSEDQGRKLESSFNALKSEKESLLTALSSMRGEVDELKRNIIIKDIELKEAAAAEHEMVALKNELNKCREELEQCSRDLDSSRKQIDTFESENEIVKNQLTIANKKINVDEVRNDIENERDALKKQLHESKINIEKMKADTPPKDATVEEMNALKDTLGKLREDLDGCNMENARVHRELEKWKSDSEKSRTELEDVKNKNMKFVGELEALRNERGHPNREMGEVILRNSRLEEDLKTMREELQNITAERNKLEAANATMNEDKAATSNSEKKTKEDISSVRIHGDLKESTDEVEYLRQENQTLSTNLQQLKNDIGKLETENEKLKADINDSSKVNNAIVEIEKRRQSAEDLTRGNAVVNNNLEMSMEDLGTMKRDTEKMIDNIESLRDGTSTEYTQLEDVKKWRRKEEELKTEIERLKKENEILKKENNGMENSLGEGGAYSQILSDIPDMSNELIRALDVIRVKMKKHKEGIIRMRDNIEKMANHIWSDASKYTDSDDAIVLNTVNPTILEVLELSNDLSATILSTEEELINLAKISRARWEENARLKKLVEDLGGDGNSKTPGLSDEKTAGDGGSFDPESWLATLTLTQLADLHDKICLSTLNLVGQDSTPEICQKPDDSSSPPCNQDDLQQNYDVHNRKIAALQREISEKQIEAGRRILEMRQILRREQAELIRISEAMYQEKKRNLILHLTIDEPPCWVNDCEGKRAKSVKFIPNIAREK